MDKSGTDNNSPKTGAYYFNPETAIRNCGDGAMYENDAEPTTRASIRSAFHVTGIGSWAKKAALNVGGGALRGLVEFGRSKARERGGPGI